MKLKFCQNSSVVTYSGMWLLCDLFHESHSLEYISQHLQAHHMPHCFHAFSAFCRRMSNDWCARAEVYCMCQTVCHLSHYPNTSGTSPVLYHGEASDLADSYVELPEVQRLLAHSGKLGDGCAPLLHEVQVSLHPAPPLWLHAQLKQARDSLAADGGGVRVGFLESDGEIKRERLACGTKYILHTLLYSLFFAVSYCSFLLQQPALPAGIIKVSSHIYTFWSRPSIKWPSKNKHFFRAFCSVCSLVFTSFTAHTYDSSHWWTKFNPKPQCLAPFQTFLKNTFDQVITE